jgi:hypothetical protein
MKIAALVILGLLLIVVDQLSPSWWGSAPAWLQVLWGIGGAILAILTFVGVVWDSRVLQRIFKKKE